MALIRILKEVTQNPKWSDRLIQKGEKESNLKYENKWRYNYLKDNINSFKVFHFNDTSSSDKVKKSCPINDNSYLREDASNLSAYLYLLQEKSPVKFRLIEETIKSVAPFFKEFILEPLLLNPDNIILKWREKESDNFFDANSFSDGTLRFICLATLLLQPNPPETIIIDEPELGLHPSAINKISGLIKSASTKTQIIISTQSVNLINNFDVEDIIVVDRGNKESSFKRLDKKSLLSDKNEKRTR